MQCAACCEVYSHELDECPSCRESNTKRSALPSGERPAATVAGEAATSVMIEGQNEPSVTNGANNSTLIEFPGPNRNRPAWRKELSERFREIQQKRAREAALEAEANGDFAEASTEGHTLSAHETPVLTADANKQLGLVPAPESPELNPIVVAALRRIERARQQPPPAPRTSQRHAPGAAAATARVYEEQIEQVEESPIAEGSLANFSASPLKAESTDAIATKEEFKEAARSSTLTVVAPKSEFKTETPHVATAEKPLAETVAQSKAYAQSKPDARKVENPAPAVGVAPQTSPQPAENLNASTETLAEKPAPRKVAGVIDEHWLERRGIELLPPVAERSIAEDDRAPLAKRIGASVFDLVAVAFLCAPFAAAIELTLGNWGDARVLASMGGIVLVMLFIYHACSIALAGRTWGMSFFSLQTVDADTARAPTTGQCARRAFAYILSLMAFGLGLLYALIDAEGRTVHDILSGTVVVKEI